MSQVWDGQRECTSLHQITGYLVTTDPAPPDHGFQYFAATAPKGSTTTLTQNIDVSSGASTINGGNVEVRRVRLSWQRERHGVSSSGANGGGVQELGLVVRRSPPSRSAHLASLATVSFSSSRPVWCLPVRPRLP